ncbi:MAG: methionine ABC transporter ATP-binding protein [Lysinibacillus sp.]
MIQLQNITKKYKTGNGELTAVKDVSLSINKGEIFGIIGYSGAGKSTMIRLLNGLEQPTSGTVTVNNQEFSAIKGQKLRDARQKVSMIFQHFNLLWSRSVAENIAFPLEIAGIPKAQRDTRVKELIALVGLEGRDKAYPSQLSGGQKQRVGIARALANNPEVLLCDEATSALDPETTDAILDLLVDINERLGLTIVLITHEMHVIRKICHRVAVMEAGEVVERGEVLQVFQSPQADITKKFVSQITDTKETQETVALLKADSPTGQLVKLVKLVFVGEKTEQPVISQLVKKFDVEVSIVHGNISQTKNGPYGMLIVQVDGSTENVTAALNYLNTVEVQTEVISNVN